MNDPSMSCNDFPSLHPNNCIARKLVEVPSILTDLTTHHAKYTNPVFGKANYEVHQP